MLGFDVNSANCQINTLLYSTSDLNRYTHTTLVTLQSRPFNLWGYLKSSMSIMVSHGQTTKALSHNPYSFTGCARIKPKLYKLRGA